MNDQLKGDYVTEKVLVTGPFGQIGSDLVPELQKLHGKDNVISLGHRYIPDDFDETEMYTDYISEKYK